MGWVCLAELGNLTEVFSLTAEVTSLLRFSGERLHTLACLHWWPYSL